VCRLPVQKSSRQAQFHRPSIAPSTDKELFYCANPEEEDEIKDLTESGDDNDDDYRYPTKRQKLNPTSDIDKENVAPPPGLSIHRSVSSMPPPAPKNPKPTAVPPPPGMSKAKSVPPPPPPPQSSAYVAPPKLRRVVSPEPSADSRPDWKCPADIDSPDHPCLCTEASNWKNSLMARSICPAQKYQLSVLESMRAALVAASTPAKKKK
jgi:hypothetical protein